MSVREGRRKVWVIAWVDFVQPFIDVLDVILMEENLEQSG